MSLRILESARDAYMRATLAVAPTNVNCIAALPYPSFSRDRTLLFLP
jgi:hypothetical protein